MVLKLFVERLGHRLCRRCHHTETKAAAHSHSILRPALLEVYKYAYWACNHPSPYPIPYLLNRSVWIYVLSTIDREIGAYELEFMCVGIADLLIECPGF